MITQDTIAAISTGMVHSGIGIVRMSGSEAINIISKVYRSPKGKKKIQDAAGGTVHYGYIYDGDLMIDEVMVVIMRAPHSYTTEDVVEIDCHGGQRVMKRILETVIKYGARPAEPGEFTKRAFLGGRIDLSQAEAVINVINAKNDLALESSLKQLRGNLKEEITALRKGIIGNIAFIEASLDDPEHIQNEHFSEELEEKVGEYLEKLESMLAHADNGRMITEGIRTVIVGKPNAGKSSLMNALLGEERAIVTEIEGTTRDTLEENISIGGVPLRIIDTAGIRDTSDIVEKIGVDKAVRSAQDADLIIYVADSSGELDDNDRQIMALIKDKKVIILLNKSDLERKISPQMVDSLIDAPVIEISAKNHTGMDDLENMIKEMFFSGEIEYNDEVLITNLRHKNEITEAVKSLEMVKNSISEGLPEDFYSIDLMDAYEHLGYILGESVGEDLVDTIFSDFCMGK